MTKREDDRWWMDRSIWIICTLLIAIGGMVYSQLSDIAEAVKPIPVLAMQIEYNKEELRELKSIVSANHLELKKKIQSIEMELNSKFSILGVQ